MKADLDAPLCQRYRNIFANCRRTMCKDGWLICLMCCVIAFNSGRITTAHRKLSSLR